MNAEQKLSEQRLSKTHENAKDYILYESLILAQDERWRRA